VIFAHIDKGASVFSFCPVGDDLFPHSRIGNAQFHPVGLADKNIAQARAEEKRAMAVALEQEMKAKAQEARAKVIEAEKEIPLAMADAFRSGNLGIMDYYKIKNIQADTEMRENIAK
ncbi:MAG: flotillin-like FloA family protein, partial [Bacteroidales bacterium]|nr:flotillin-like FloA family protein [Bacteroidales bacterium]